MFFASSLKDKVFPPCWTRSIRNSNFWH